MEEKRDKWFWPVFLVVVALSVTYAERHRLHERYLGYQTGKEQIRQQALQQDQLKREIEAAQDTSQ